MLGIVRTDQAVPKLRVRLEVLAVVQHGLAQVANGQDLLLVLGVVAPGEGLDVDGGSFVELLHAWQILAGATAGRGREQSHTVVAEGHLHLEGPELLRDIGLGLGAHLLTGPLLDAIEALVDIHDGGDSGVIVRWWFLGILRRKG